MQEIEKEEILHLTKVIKSSQDALIKKDPIRLKELSNQVTHSSCIYQHRGLVTIAIIIYALGKVIERKDYEKIASWDLFVKKFNSQLSEATTALKENDLEKYDTSIQQSRKHLESVSISLKPYIKGILAKASINKGSKIYEHGISLERTAKLLGVTQWDLSEYTGHSRIPDTKQNISVNTKTRAKMALEFFT